MSKFKVGDRVAVYAGFRATAKVVEGLNEYGTIGVLLDGRFERNFVHPKQCRKLVKKPRRRVWIPKYQLNGIDNRGVFTAIENLTLCSNPAVEMIEFVEVRSSRTREGK